ncbi:MAG TPA: helix-turn-helix domain-containing protein [Solirubrobacterales bacterium]|nr:helix-turn-helix domain-containing protein [Solirubrobacterales bacterium]
MPPPFNSDKSFEPRLARALDHPVRARFLKLLADREAVSPVEALPLLDLDGLKLSSVAYHARVLELLELVEPAGETNQLGGSPFTTTSKGEAALMALGLPPEEANGE